MQKEPEAYTRTPAFEGAYQVTTIRNLIKRYFDAIFAIGCVSLFLGYFSLCCFKTRWAGDIQIYFAVVHSLYEDFWDPMHQTVAVSGRYSNYYGPYLVAVAGFGKLLGLTGYRALQWAGVFNLLFYVMSIFYFFRNHSLFKKSWLPPALFIIVSTLLQNQYFHWSSEITFRSLMSMQAYPSMFGWAAGLFCFGLAQRFLDCGRFWAGIGVTALIWLVLLSHPLTATWVVGILGIQGIIALAQKRLDVLRRVVGLYGFVITGIAITQFWPYKDLIGVAIGSIGIQENPPFEGHPFRWMLWLYLLSIPCVFYFVRIRRHGFLIFGFVATFLAYCVSQLLGIDYANRYIIFQAFFAQVAVAEVAAIGPLLLLGCSKARKLPQTGMRIGHLAFALFTLIVLVGAFWSPAVRQAKSRGVLHSPSTLLRQPSPHDGYYKQFDEFRRFLKPGDIVMAPNRPLNNDLPPVTGARAVIASPAVRVPDYEGRLRDTKKFFASGTTKDERDAILARYKANRILLGPWDMELKEEIERDYGSAAVRGERFVLFVLEEVGGDIGAPLRSPPARSLSH